MKILIYGSTLLTEVACRHLKDKYDLVGYIPSRNPTVKGEVPLKEVTADIDHDIKLSLGYDMRIREFQNAYNIHPGLLPEYGGCDILYHTIRNKEQYQGLTFHKMVHAFDAGPIICRATYPVFSTDTMVTLYKRVLDIYPSFTEYCLRLLSRENLNLFESCSSQTPTLYRRGAINEEDKDLYDKTYLELKELKNDLSNNTL